MLYPFMTLNDNTEIVHSELLNLDGKEKVKLSIPEWINEAAMAMDLNFSQVLQEALISKIQA